jgi:alanine racemase
LVDRTRIRSNVLAVRAKAGVAVLPVIKSDAYGHGAVEVVEAIKDVSDGFCVFSLEEARSIDLGMLTIKPGRTLSPPQVDQVELYLRHGVRPAVTTVEQARALREARPILCVDTGMQRFACPPEQIDAVIKAGDIKEAFTHATRVEHAEKLVELLGNRGMTLHAAATALLDEARARLDAVRPGWAIYRGAARVATHLVEVHDARGPAGYTGFTTSTNRHGVILMGYSSGLHPGPCSVNGERRRVIEVGMQSAFVEIGPADRVGDEVVLLGDGVTETDVASAWGGSPQEALTTLARSGRRTYRD